MNTKITVVGSGYVGLSNAVLLAQNNEVTLLDIVQEKIDMVNNKQSPIQDVMIEEYLANKELNLTATMDKVAALSDAEYIVVATPTDYCPDRNYFNTESIQNIILDVIEYNPEAMIVIKSTIPVGFVHEMRQKYKFDNIIFSPEFLREGNALLDCLYPSRVIIGDKSNHAKEFAALLVDAAEKSHDEIPVLFMGAVEAEAVKLFANGYLAMRVAFFNELDMYAESLGLNAESIILGASLDPRIGNDYNNPSFGYGGYCFPKDTKQLLSNYNAAKVPNNIIQAIVDSNDTRKEYIAQKVLEKKPSIVGVYRLTMKSGSDNFRSSAIQDIINKLKNPLGHEETNVIIYEPTLPGTSFQGCKVIKDIKRFKDLSDVIIANRVETAIADVQDKIYTRDIFLNN